MKSREVPRHIKIERRTVLKSIVAGGKLQEKLQEAVCCQFFQGSVQLLENVSSTSGLGSTWLAGAKLKSARRKYKVMMLSRQQKGSNRTEPLK